MSNDANCSFCSHIDDSIYVICEGRCLICSHCQRAVGIQQLLIKKLDEKPGLLHFAIFYSLVTGLFIILRR